MSYPPFSIFWNVVNMQLMLSHNSLLSISVTTMSARTYVVGVGMTQFFKPKTKDWDYPDMARESG